MLKELTQSRNMTFTWWKVEIYAFSCWVHQVSSNVYYQDTGGGLPSFISREAFGEVREYVGGSMMFLTIPF